MKFYRVETVVNLSTDSVATIHLEGHVSAAEIISYLKEKYPTKTNAHGEVPFRGRAAHLEKDGLDSVKNFSFDERGIEFDVWEG